MTGGLSAKRKSQIERFAGVVARASHFHQVPARSEIPSAHFRIGFKASGSHHHSAAAQISYAVSGLNSHSSDCASLIGQEPRRLGFIYNVDALLLRGCEEHFHEPQAAVVDRY